MEHRKPCLAATVLLVRDSDAGPQIFMVRRHPKSTFMANAHVFVGGRLEESDLSVAMAARVRGLSGGQAASRLGLRDTALALGLYVAALRETFEESGVLLAEGDAGASPGAAELSRMRDGLNHGGQRFAALLGDAGLHATPGRLRYLAHWITPAFEPRRFDTYFFVCVVPADQPASHDHRESTDGQWFTVARLLAGNRRRELLLPPPTLCVLESVARAENATELLAIAADRPVAAIQPRPLLESAGEVTLLLPGDHRYRDPRSAEGARDCVVLTDGHWQHVIR